MSAVRNASVPPLETLWERLRRAAGVEEDVLRDTVEREEGLVSLLVARTGLSEEEALRTMADVLGYRFETEIETRLSPAFLSGVSLAYLKKHLLVPLSLENGVLCVASCEPLHLLPLDDLAHALGCRRCEVIVSPRREILRVLQGWMHPDDESTRRLMEDLDEQTGKDKILEELDQVEDLLDSTSQAPVIRLVNMIFAEAVKRRASDVHIEPYAERVLVRYRIDGVLYEFLDLQRRVHASLISRIKVLADLNIAERRLPQDGRIQIKMGGREIDIRVSILPTIFGERVVLRLLDKKSAFKKLTDLGFSPEAFRIFERIIQRTHGIILVTGPTGSGKTTTLYGALTRINSRDKNIITVEDPIEYQLPGIGQIQVAPKIGLTFANGLRSILRHDPDVIMIGEIRDRETAEIAVQASLTGHLVFSTLHTNDAASAVTRLVDMGIEPFLITSSVVGVMAQRLVRTICPHCRRSDDPDPVLLRELGIASSAGLYRGTGCLHCFQTGYYGRTCINEILVVDDTVRRLVLENADATRIKEQAVSKGMVTLRQDGVRKALAGITTVEEVLRVTQE